MIDWKALKRPLLYGLLMQVCWFAHTDLKAQVDVSSVTVNTVGPDDCTQTSITVSGMLGAANYSYQGFTVSIVGTTVNVSVNYTSGLIILPAITPFTQTFNIGPLNSGTNTIIATGYLNNVAGNQTSSTQVNVGSCCSIDASFTPNAYKLCSGDSLLLTNTSTNATSYVWSQNGSTIGTGTNQSLVFNSSVPQTFQLFADNGNCQDSMDITVVPAILDLGPDTMFCSPQGYQLDSDTGWATTLWSTGAGSQKITPTVGGDYSVAVTTSTGCQLEDTVNVWFPDNLNLGPDTTACSGDSFVLTVNGTWDNINWGSGDTTASISVTTPGSYSVAVNANGCLQSDVINVSFINVIPGLGPDRTLCPGDTLTILTSNWDSYQWNDGSTGNTLLVWDTGTYSVIATDTASGCTGYDEVVVTPNLPFLNLGGTGNHCIGQATVIDPGTGWLNHSWSDGSTGSTLTVTSGGFYSLTAMNLNGCHYSDTIELIDRPTPDVELGNDTTICSNEQLNLDATTSGQVSYEWQNGVTTPVFQTSSSGMYSVTVTNQYGCSEADTIQVTVEDCTGLDEFQAGTISIYPNPTAAFLTIEVETDLTVDRAVLLDLSGKVVMTTPLSPGNNRLDVTPLAKGTYILSILKSDNPIHESRIVIN